MGTTLAFLGIFVALLMGAMSPGPSFVLVARTAIAASRADGLAAALGMGLGAVIFGALVLLGLHTVLARVGWLYLGLKLAGGLYLVSLAVRLWRGAATPLTMLDQDGQRRDSAPLRSGLLGLATQISNPKTALVYGGIFAALLPAEMPPGLAPALLALIFVVEAGWYALVALAFSAGRPRAAYLRAKTWIDRTTGAALGVLGLRLMAEAASGD